MTHWEKPHRNAADVLAVDVLDAFAGGGMVRVLERRPHAVILERLQPGMFDERRGWIAIDPHGVAGEVEYEPPAALRNPVEQPGMLTEAGVFERRVDVFVRELPVDADRIRRWAFAAAVLAAIWTIEDGVDPALRQRWIAFAGMIQPRA